jgi:hypothetical protein
LSYYAAVAFGLIVGERHGGIMKEAQRILFAQLEAQEEIMSGAAWCAGNCPGRVVRGSSWTERRYDAIVTPRLPETRQPAGERSRRAPVTAAWRSAGWAWWKASPASY